MFSFKVLLQIVFILFSVIQTLPLLITLFSFLLPSYHVLSTSTFYSRSLLVFLPLTDSGLKGLTLVLHPILIKFILLIKSFTMILVGDLCFNLYTFLECKLVTDRYSSSTLYSWSMFQFECLVVDMSYLLDFKVSWKLIEAYSIKYRLSWKMILIDNSYFLGPLFY
jgi:hypothetical protein